MNALYHIAIIEGFLGQHQHLPKNVQDAIEHLKQATTPKAIEQPIVQRKKKRKMTPEQREAMLSHMEKMRVKQGRPALSAEHKEKILEMRKHGKTREEIAAAIARSTSAVDYVLYSKK